MLIRLLVLVLALTSALAPLWSSSADESADRVPQPFVMQLDFTGPIPLHHQVRLWVDQIQIVQSGDLYSPGDVKFRFRMDVGPCPSFQEAINQNGSFSRTFGPGSEVHLDDCSYAHVDTLGPWNVFDQQVLDVDVWLPSPTEEELRPSEALFRYSGDLIRARIGGTELDPLTDERMGGLMLAVRCGYPGYTGGCPTWGMQFDTCNVDYPSGNIEEWPCYSLDGRLLIEPKPIEPEQNLVVSEVLGPGHCVVGRDLTLGVRLHNPETSTSDPFRVRVGLLDPETRRIVESWDSDLRLRLPGGETTEAPVPVTVRLPERNQELMVAAVSFEPRPFLRASSAYMASAVELAIGCLPDFLDDPVRLPTPSATPSGERPAPVFRQPTATPTPDPDHERTLPLPR